MGNLHALGYLHLMCAEVQFSDSGASSHIRPAASP